MLWFVTPASHTQGRQSPSYTNSSNLCFLIWTVYTEGLRFFQFNSIDLFIWHRNVMFFSQTKSSSLTFGILLLPQHKLAIPHHTSFFTCMNSIISCFLKPLFFVVFTFTTFNFQSYAYFYLWLLHLNNLEFFWEIF